MWNISFGTGKPSYQFWHFCDFLLSSYGQTCARQTITRGPVTLDVTKHAAGMWVIVRHICTKFEARRSSLRKIWYIFRLGINRSRPWPWPLSFQSLNWLTVTHVIGAFFLLIFSLLRPSILHRVRRGTDRRQTSMRGGGIVIIRSCLYYYSSFFQQTLFTVHCSLSAVTHAQFHASMMRPASQAGPMHEAVGVGEVN